MAKKRAAQKRKLEAQKTKTEEDDEETAKTEENGESPKTTKRKAGKSSNSKSSVSASTSETATKKGTKNVKEKDEEEEEDEDETDYEVEKIVGVNYLKDDTREFLIRWKNYSSKDDTWEPEENLSCPELIRKFLDSEEKKSKMRKQLREKPKTTSKFVSPAGRKSRRNLGKEKSYVENEDSD